MIPANTPEVRAEIQKRAAINVAAGTWVRPALPLDVAAFEKALTEARKRSA